MHYVNIHQQHSMNHMNDNRRDQTCTAYVFHKERQQRTKARLQKKVSFSNRRLLN